MTEPLDLPDPTLEALIDVGNKALADYYHERACSCSTWPESCHSKLGAWQWETDAFAIALPAILAAWQGMQAAPAQPEPVACTERLGDAVCTLLGRDRRRHVTANGDYWYEAADCAQNGCEHDDCQESALYCGAKAANGAPCCYIAQHRESGKPHSFEEQM